MSCQHNTVSRCHQCCSPIIVQVPGLQGTGIVWETCTESEKKEITDRILDPVIDYANKVEQSVSDAKELAEKTQEIYQNSLVSTGTSCYEVTLDITKATPAGTQITIPNGYQYIVGKFHLLVFYGGVALALGQSLKEIGDIGKFSSKFSLTIDLKVGDQLTIRIEALGKEVVDTAAQQFASSASNSANQAQTLYNKILQKQGEIIDQVSSEGTYQINRIKGEVDNELVTNGVGGNEKFWVVPTDIPAGALIEIPGNVRYIVGRHHFHVSWNGIQLYLGQNFEEVGTEDTTSSKFKLTFNIHEDDELDVKVSVLGNKTVNEALALAGEASAAVAELSRKVVYKEETE